MPKTNTSNQPTPTTRAKYFVKFTADRIRSKGVKTWNAFQNLKASDVLDEGLFTELFAVDKEFGDAVKIPLTTKLQNLISERAQFFVENPPEIKDGVPSYSKEWIIENQRLNNEIGQVEKAIEAAKKRAAEKAEEENQTKDEAKNQTAEASA